MPNLIDIVEVAEALESKAVFLAPDRCTVAVSYTHLDVYKRQRAWCARIPT